jgi:multiple sugar transport system permease protein
MATNTAQPLTATTATAGAPPASRSRSIEHGGNRAGWLFAAPFLLVYALFLIGPMLYGLLMSLFNTTTVQGGLGRWVGLANYAEALTSPDFWASMWHTLLFTLLTTPPLVLLALLLAILAERMKRGKWFYRLVFFAPYVVPSASVVLIFSWIYAPEIGLLGRAFTVVGLPEPAFLGSPNWAMIAVAILTVWWSIGFNFVLYLAGMQEIPGEVYEAAEVDGASPWQQIRSITLPLLSSTTILVTVLQILASLRVFDQIYLLLEGGPNYSTRPVIEYIYDVGFTNYRAGYAAAATTIYFLVLVGISVGWYLFNRRREARDRAAAEQAAQDAALRQATPTATRLEGARA